MLATFDLVAILMILATTTSWKETMDKSEKKDRIQMRISPEEYQQLDAIAVKWGLSWPDVQKTVLRHGLSYLLSDLAKISSSETADQEINKRLSALEIKVKDLEHCPFVGQVLTVANNCLFVFVPKDLSIDRGYHAPHLRKLFWVDRSNKKAAFTRVIGDFKSTNPGRLKQLNLEQRGKDFFAISETDFVEPISIGIDIRTNAFLAWPGPEAISTPGDVYEL